MCGLVCRDVAFSHITCVLLDESDLALPDDPESDDMDFDDFDDF